MSDESTQYAAEVGALVGDRRQRIVTAVHERGRTVTVDELADVVAEWEAERGLDPDWEAIHEHLVEVDLPALDEAELLVFDPESGVVDTRRTVVDAGPNEDDGSGRSWLAYLVVAAAAGVAVAAGVATFWPGVSTATLWPTWAAGAVAVLVVAAVVAWVR